jgi:hypothetical protein
MSLIRNGKPPSSFLPSSGQMTRAPAHLSSADLSDLLQAFRSTVITGGAPAKEWQQRALKAWHATARAWESATSAYQTFLAWLSQEKTKQEKR